MSYAERNRAIKKLMVEAFKPHKVSVKGGRGTASNWVSIDIDYRPKTSDELKQLEASIWALLDAAKIKIGTYGYDDPGGDYGYGKTLQIYFGKPRDVFSEGERVTWPNGGKTGVVKDRPFRLGGDWYLIQWDDAAPGALEEFHKVDLASLEAPQ